MVLIARNVCLDRLLLVLVLFLLNVDLVEHLVFGFAFVFINLPSPLKKKSSGIYLFIRDSGLFHITSFTLTATPLTGGPLPSYRLFESVARSCMVQKVAPRGDSEA